MTSEPAPKHKPGPKARPPEEIRSARFEMKCSRRWLAWFRKTHQKRGFAHTTHAIEYAIREAFGSPPPL